ncbi:MAG TPA: DUF3320 domain-containing protein [Dehalococcoidia bacterium]|nr:DUF3320 domain-containing protein [Dehalococcoidia bacterium]
MSRDERQDPVPGPEMGQPTGGTGFESDDQQHLGGGSFRQSLQNMEDAANELAQAMGLPAPRGQAQRQALIMAARRAVDSPDLIGINLAAPEWTTLQAELDELLNAGTALARVHEKLDSLLTPEAWGQDVGHIRNTLAKGGGFLSNLLSGERRRAKAAFSQMCAGLPPDELPGQLEVLDAVLDSQSYARVVSRHLPLGALLFGEDRISDPLVWPSLAERSAWCREVLAEIATGSAPAGLLDYLSSGQPSDTLRPLLLSLEQVSASVGTHSESVQAKLESARRDLLDLGLRNPLLNYRLLRSRGVDITGHQPRDIFTSLADEDRTAVLLPAGESTGPRRGEIGLETVHPADELERRLLSTHRLANTFIQEQGVNTLFLALGMLRWRDNGSGPEQRLAPLVLLPVSLERPTLQGRYRLRQTGDEPETNVSMREKLRLEFGVALPGLPETEGPDLGTYFDAVTESLAGLDGWEVDREHAALGFFSFSKFLMYRDLDAANWPDDASPAEHPIIGALLEDGFDEPAPRVTSDDHLDALLPPGSTYQVVDADGSQTLTLLDANQGLNLVVQGPPGTGKSQTITNMIAEAVGNGRTVLFVSEKMAALEVVKRRLDNVGLGDACLELHSHKTAKKVVLDELSRTLELGRPRTGAVGEDLTELARLRERLNGYCDAMNQPLGQSGVSPFQAAGELLARSGDGVPHVAIESIDQWTQADYRRRRGAVEELQARVVAMGPPQEHPFRHARLLELLPAGQDALQSYLEDCRIVLATLVERVEGLAERMWLGTPTDLEGTNRLTASARRSSEAPNLVGLDIKSGLWTQRLDDVTSLLELGSSMAALKTGYAAELLPTAWELDLFTEKQVLENEGSKPWRLLLSNYREVKTRLSGLFIGGSSIGAKEMLALVDDVRAYQEKGAQLERLQGLGMEAFGGRWQGRDSDWPELSRVVRWLAQLHRDIAAGELSEGLLDYLSFGAVSDQLSELARRVEYAVADVRLAASDVTFGMDLDLDRRFDRHGALADQPFDQQKDLIDGCLAKMESVHDVVRLNVQGSACQAEGLGAMFDAAYQWTGGETALVDAYDRAWYRQLWEQALAERNALRSFAAAAHEQVRESFQDLDRRLLAHNRTRLAQSHWDGMPRQQGGGQLAVLRRQFEIRRRHLPIRQLLERALNPVQAIKPVFMMSPLSIAAYLSAGGMTFDLVVFDEASQVKPVDALGAVMRGRQVVVVGDSQQLPPTPFFETVGQVDEYSEDETTADIESILGLFAAQNAPSRMLRWHYRSRHESLIAVSNHEFYGGGLVLFPSPDANREQAGLVYHHLPDTVYSRGTTGTNPLEADAVAQAVLAHARERPGLSLGVAAFSMAQARAIQDRLEELRGEDSSAEAFFAAHPDEPFFVKNLETVQGDERDVVLVSIGYGRAEDGRVDLNFGPLNRDGGERRLNVLITRARLRCEVFTNLTEDDIDPQRARSQGIRALRTFLAFARWGELEPARESDAGALSGFQEHMAKAITEAGYPVNQSPGLGTDTIDLAVSDPARPGRYILGIECDGPCYDSARSARDRDRLRPQVLEGLGWRLHRAWSPEWTRNPAQELERVLTAIKEPVSLGEEPEPEQSVVISREDRPAPKPSTVVSKYQMANLERQIGGADLTAVPSASLVKWSRDVVKKESPVHMSEIQSRIMAGAGVTRAGKSVADALDAAVERIAGSKSYSRRGDFFWLTDMDTPPVRDRSGLPASARRFDMVCDEELAEAVGVVVGQSYGMARSQTPSSAARLLGYSRTTEAMKTRIDAVVGQLLTSGRLVDESGHLVLGAS